MYRLQRISIYEMLFFTSLTLYLIPRCFEYTIWVKQIENLCSVTKAIAYIILLPCLIISMLNLLNKYRFRNLIVISVTVFFLVYLVAFNINAGFVCFGYSVAAIKINKKRLFAYLEKLLVLLLVLVIILGLFDGNIETRKIGDTRRRFAFGFSDSYTLQMIWMSIVTCCIFTVKRKNIGYFFSILLITLLLHFAGDTRTTFITTIMLILTDYFFDNNKKSTWFSNSKHNHFVFRYIFVICFILINSLCWVNYRAPTYITFILDGLFTGRISTTTRYIQYVCNGVIPLLPIKGVNFNLMDVAALSSLALDSSYSQMLFGYGIIYSLVCLYILHEFSCVAVNNSYLRVCIILFSIAINGILQPTVMSILYNPVILLSFDLIIQSKSHNKRIKMEAL